MSQKALKFKHTAVPRQEGEQARLKIVEGPDLGAVFVLLSHPISLGRGEDNDVVLSDLKASRAHARLSQVNESWMIQDQGSSNGIAFRGKEVRKAQLVSNDLFTLGETTLEFMTADQGTRLLLAPPRSAQEVRAEQAAFEKQKEKVRALAGMGSLKKTPGLFQAGGKKKPSPLLLVVLGLGAILFLLPTNDKNKKSIPGIKKKESLESRDLASYLPPGDLTSDREAETFFKTGFREYRVKNYLRAKAQFETVLQMNPGHKLATIYLENCERAIQGEIKKHLKEGKRDLELGALKEAQYHFETVMRLLEKDQANPAFTEAQDQYQQVLKKLKKGTG